MADWIKYNPTSKLWELSTNDGGSFSTLDVDAAQITSGAFAKARQNAQTPYKDETNTFTEIQTFNAIPYLAGGGIKFPASQIASADANTLDDFEVGSWTPTIGGDGGTSGQTYSATRHGYYIKWGDWVIVLCNVALTAKGTITGSVQIQGLPFTSISSGAIGAVCNGFWITATSYYAITTYTAPNASAFYIRAISAATTIGSGSGLTSANIADNSQFVFTAIYRAAA